MTELSSWSRATTWSPNHQVDPVAARLPEQAGELAPQDLQLGGRTVTGAGLGRKLRDGASVVVDEPRPDLAGASLAHRLQQVHPLEHVAGQTADVDVLPARSRLGRTLENCDVVADLVEPVRRRGTGDARARDQDAGRAMGVVTHATILPVLPRRHGSGDALVEDAVGGQGGVAL